MTSREDFIKRLFETFRIEASESIARTSSNLIELEKGTSEEETKHLIESIFRDIHSLKGAARAVNLSDIESVCQAMETVFSELKNQTLSLTDSLFDLFHQTASHLNELLQISSETGTIGSTQKTRKLLGQLKDYRNFTTENVTAEDAATKTATETSVTEQSKKIQPALFETGSDHDIPLKEKNNLSQLVSKSDNTIRISVEKLDSLLNQAEEMLALKQAILHFHISLQKIQNKLEVLQKETTQVSSGFHQAQTEGNQTKAVQTASEYFDWAASLLKTSENDLEVLRKRTGNESHNSGIKVESLLNEVKKIISVPFSLILDGLPKAARDLAKDQKKKVKVEVTGSNLEIDRRILEELRSPFIHLLRNTIDHGIETPEVRIKKGKPETGLIRIEVVQLENNRISISFSDDGSGINLEKVRMMYLRQEGISMAEANQIPENILLNSLFKSGFSTSDLITDISGRGLGLSIVQEKVEQLGGTVSTRTAKDTGTEFKIEVPLSLVTFRGVTIRIGDSEFVLPTSKLSKVIRIEKSSVQTVESKQTFNLDGKTIPLLFLSALLEIPWKEQDGAFWITLLLGEDSRQMGFVVDSIVDEELILVKKFNSQLKRVRNISGATVLGSGKVVPILNVSDLLKSAVTGSTPKAREQEKESKKHSVLVVEDSITSRMLLKNILETAGYTVSTAIDGIDGFTRLKEERVDLVISDVDMPRMNGFDMTAKIRADKSLNEIPVILVTSLSKREDRERGLEVGANAYIVKSNFDQSNLFGVIERLIG